MYELSVYSHRDVKRNTAVGVVVIALDWQLKEWWFKPTLDKKLCNEAYCLNIDEVQL
jgi:hypothetical protein